MRRLLVLFCAALVATSAALARKIRVACVGNSVTYGYLLPDREQKAYPACLQRLLGDDYEVRNFGHSGATLLRHGHRPYTQLPEFREALDFRPDLVVIHLGLNDTDPRNWPNYRDEFVSDYGALIDSFQTASPKCRIWACRMTPIFDRHARFRSGTRDWHAKIQRAIEVVARSRQTGLIDLEGPLHNRPELFADALHPNAEGAEIIARTVCGALTGRFGGLQMPAVYSDSMIIQRNRPLPVTGRADAGEKVTVSIAGKRYKTVAGPDGRWSVTLDPLATGGPYVLDVESDGRHLTFRDVQAGEVWICSGQSNMAFQLRRAATAKRDLEQAARGDLRFYNMQVLRETNAEEWEQAVLDSVNELRYFQPAAWHTSNARTAAEFSAVAYHFGRMLADSLKAPVGLILNAVGGSPIEAWIDRRTLEQEMPDILRDWRNNDFIQPWVRQRASQNVKLAASPLQRHPYEPTYLFEAGIEPLEHFPVAGVTWYQGESNAHNMEAHEQLFRLFAKSWRGYWQEDALPICFVQLSSTNRPSWPWFRDSQRRLAAAVPHCGMAVCSDLGDSLDVHPTHKQEVGERLARLALTGTYGVSPARLSPCGPLLRSVSFEGSKARVAFYHAEGLKTSDGKPARTFELAGDDLIFHEAKAVLGADGSATLQADGVDAPRYVRYGWQPFTRANLVNGEGLPASTFTTENP